MKTAAWRSLRRRAVGVALIAMITALAVAVVAVESAGADPTKGFRLARVWGSQGSGNGQFRWAEAIASDLWHQAVLTQGASIYVADTDNHRVQAFSSTGALTGMWGSPGSGDGQFGADGPTDVAVGGRGAVYVADPDNSRIQVFTSAGRLERQWGPGPNGDTSQAQYLSRPYGVAVSPNEWVYVLDRDGWGSFRGIKQYSSAGAFVRSWGCPGSAAQQGDFTPVAIATDRWGYVYVTDLGNHCVWKWDGSGTWIRKWGAFGTTGRGYFGRIAGITVDYLGYVYVCDTANPWLVQVFTNKGAFVTQWSQKTPRNGASGMAPQDVAVDISGLVYVLDGSASNSVWEFAPGRDTKRPVPKARRNVSVRRGKVAKLPCRVNDADSATCTVRVRLYRKSGGKLRYVVGYRATNVPTNRDFTCPVSKKLGKGTYVWKVYASDAAGNKQRRASSKLLWVR